MFKLWDYTCQTCLRTSEYMVEPDENGVCAITDTWHCPTCNKETTHLRLLVAKFAKYTGEAVREFSPAIHGGNLDTMGYKDNKEARLPEFKTQADQDYRKLRMEGATHADAFDQVESYAPDFDDYKAHTQTKEFKERKELKAALATENKAKRVRAKAIAKGETTVKASPLPGDPKRLSSRS